MSEMLSPAAAHSEERARSWLRLDNAGLIYPSTYSKTQNHLYRLTSVLSEPVDKAVLYDALQAILPRFPSIAVSLHRGMFWYYLEPIMQAPAIQDEGAWPLMHMSFRSIRKCGFRTLVDGNRLSLEFFHGITDGGGAMVFFKTLLAEYLERRYGITVSCTDGVLDRTQTPTKDELEDCFLRFAGPSARRRDSLKTYQLEGTLEDDGYLTWTTLTYNAAEAVKCAKAHGVTLTGMICSAMLLALEKIQHRKEPHRRPKDVAVNVPVNLRQMMPTSTLRNFSLFATVDIDPAQGEWTFDEVCRRVGCQMGERVTQKEMAACAAANARAGQMPVVRVMPLPLKNLVMKAAYHLLGGDGCCLAISNLGIVRVPDEMLPYVRDIQCQMDSHAGSVSSCCLLSFGDKLHITFCRCIREPDLEYAFYQVLRDEGLRAEVQSNAR